MGGMHLLFIIEFFVYPLEVEADFSQFPFGKPDCVVLLGEKHSCSPLVGPESDGKDIGGHHLVRLDCAAWQELDGKTYRGASHGDIEIVQLWYRNMDKFLARVKTEKWGNITFRRSICQM